MSRDGRTWLSYTGPETLELLPVKALTNNIQGEIIDLIDKILSGGCGG